MLIDNNENNSSGNNGNRGKFSDRLKKIRRDRLNKNKRFEEAEDSVIINFGRNILKVFLALPTVVYTHIVSSRNSEDEVVDKKRNNNSKNSKKSVITNASQTDDLSEEDTIVRSNSSISKKKSDERRIKINKIRDIDVTLLKKNKQLLLKYHSADKVDSVINAANDIEEKIEKLQKEILDLIKKKLVHNINELEVLHSEFYLLNEMSLGDVYLDECQKDIKEVKKLLSKVKALKEKYDYLKDNVDFEYMLEYGDDTLIDKILELKELCSREDVRYVVDNYKLLDEYKFLYLKIDKLQDDTIKFEEYKNKKAEELKRRDIEFDKLKNDAYDLDRENERYERFVKEQEMFLRELEDKISHIDSYEQITYKLKGFEQLMSNSFKYLGLLLVNPLKGLIPGIATQTLITKNLVQNLYNNLEWQKNKRMVYEAVDFSTSINVALNNLDNTSNLVDSTLEDIVRLKKTYTEEFAKYSGDFSAYKEIIKKINKIENAVLGSKIKIQSMQIKLKEKERQNINKMKKVKKLNSTANS